MCSHYAVQLGGDKWQLHSKHFSSSGKSKMSYATFTDLHFWQDMTIINTLKHTHTHKHSWKNIFVMIYILFCTAPISIFWYPLVSLIVIYLFVGLSIHSFLFAGWLCNTACVVWLVSCFLHGMCSWSIETMGIRRHWHLSDSHIICYAISTGKCRKTRDKQTSWFMIKDIPCHRQASLIVNILLIVGAYVQIPLSINSFFFWLEYKSK